MNNSLSFNFFNVLILLGALQGFIFSSIVLFKNKSSSNFYLALVILFLSLNNLYYSFIDAKIEKVFTNFTYLYLPFKLLVLPTFYLFIRKYLRLDVKINNHQKVLFLPFIIVLFFHILYSILNYLNLYRDTSLVNLLYYIEEYASLILSFYVIYRSYRFIINYEKNNFNYSKESIKVNTSWIKKLLIIGVIICLIWSIVILKNHFNNEDLFNNYNRYFIWISITFLIYWIGYLGIYYNDIFIERKIIREKKSQNSIKKNKPQKSNSRITETIENDKLYLDPKLSLQLIAEKLELNSSYVSQIFNKNSTINFSQYINKLRILHAKKILLDKEYSNYTLVSIALESGFNSKSAFYTAFKKETGITPTEFRKQNSS